MDANKTVERYIRENFPELIDRHTNEVNCAELGRLSGENQPTLHRFFKGETGNPRIKLVQSIANGLRVPLHELLNTDVQSNRAKWNNIEGANSTSILSKAPVLEYGDISMLDSVLQSHHDGSIRKKEFFVMSGSTSSRCFYLQIQDDSNSPELIRNEYVLIDPDKKPSPEDFVLAMGKHGPMIGRLSVNDDDSFTAVSGNNLIRCKILDDMSNLVGVKRGSYRDGSK